MRMRYGPRADRNDLRNTMRARIVPTVAMEHIVGCGVRVSGKRIKSGLLFTILRVLIKPSLYSINKKVVNLNFLLL